MKMKYNILILAIAALTVIACTDNDEIIDFTTDIDVVEVEADGGVKRVRIQSSDEWIALVEQNAPWIAVSPANGRGTVTCDFVIDSALTAYPR
ncbi:MAG: BACON domain-containing protein, partial [Alistipes sp.]|nr:BACON domain-containing protein [Alistipes sp.]